MDLNINGPIATYVSAIMRVPPLFIMDEILKLSFGLASTADRTLENRLSNYITKSQLLEGSNPFSDSLDFDDPDSGGAMPPEEFLPDVDPVSSSSSSLLQVVSDATLQYVNASSAMMQEPHLLPFLTSPVTSLVLRVIILTLVFLLCKVWFSLCWPHLLSLYSVIGSLACVIASYQGNVAAVHHFFASAEAASVVPQPPLLHTLLSLDVSGLMRDSRPLLALASNYVVQALLYLVFICLQVDIEDTVFVKGLMIWAFLLPSCSMLVTFSKDVTLTISFLCALVPLLMTKWRVIKGMPYALSVVVNGFHYAQDVINTVGPHTLLEAEWSRLNIPNVLRLFWSLRIANFITFSIADHLHQQESHNIITLLDPAILYNIFKTTMTYGCDTVLALLGMTSVVSYISHYIGVFFQMLLLTDDEDDRSMGTVSAILFFVLAEQSGLTVLENEKRYIRLCRNFCLLFTAMLYFVHNMVNPVLLSLSASRNPSLYRHGRALGVCALLLLLPLGLLYGLWSVFSLSTWLLAVSAFSVQVVIKTLVTVLIYALFLADAYYSLFWDNLDDYVYYIKAFGNTIEFLFGIVLFFNGLWIYFFESGGAIRALMMCVHAYINIWCEAKNGWAAFMKRRNAVNKIASIPDATAKELKEHDDVCTICFQVLTSAKITKCKHFYHEVCLRKWLYVQDSCPLCHQTLYSKDPEELDRIIRDENMAALHGLAEGIDGVEVATVPRRNADIPVDEDIHLETIRPVIEADEEEHLCREQIPVLEDLGVRGAADAVVRSSPEDEATEVEGIAEPR